MGKRPDTEFREANRIGTDSLEAQLERLAISQM